MVNIEEEFNKVKLHKNKLFFSYFVRISPVIISIIGLVLNNDIIFYIGGIICLAVHVILFFRQTLSPFLLIILIYIFSFIYFRNINGILWGGLISTFFELFYHAIKTYYHWNLINKTKK